MLIVETIARVRRDYFVDGKSIKAIMRDRKISRNTVRKIVRGGETAFCYERRSQPRPRLEPCLDDLNRLLEENAKQPARCRRTIRQICDVLQESGYEGGYDSVLRYARQWESAHTTGARNAFIPLWFAPGEACQFDWSHEDMLLAGMPMRIKVAHVRLCHSRMFLLVAYPRETQEMVFDAHDRAFSLFGGACRRGIYDNMKTAVDAVFVGKKRQFNRRFERMCSHYLVEPVACTPRAGWEKGQVENQVGNARKWFFSPRPRFQSLAELNAWLADRCMAHARVAAHPDIPDKTVWEVFEEERSALIPYPGAFDGWRETSASATKTCLVRFDRNRYSVAAQAAVVLEQKTPILVLLELQILAEAEEVLTTMLLVLVEKA